MPSCECGCGAIARKRFVKGHIINALNADGRAYRSGAMERSPNWKGGVTRSNGYVVLKDPTHPNANKNGQVSEHVAIVARVLGHAVPPGAEVHHINEDRSDNRNSNLVVCQDHAYHMLLHRRSDALREAGNANFLRCEHCKKWDAPEKMKQSSTRTWRAYHPECNNEAARRLRAKKGTNV